MSSYRYAESNGGILVHVAFTELKLIKGYVNNLSEYLKEAEALNTQLLALVHESEHEAVLIWYEEQL
jgi:hypothetical protein